MNQLRLKAICIVMCKEIGIRVIVSILNSQRLKNMRHQIIQIGSSLLVTPKKYHLKIISPIFLIEQTVRKKMKSKRQFRKQITDKQDKPKNYDQSNSNGHFQMKTKITTNPSKINNSTTISSHIIIVR